MLNSYLLNSKTAKTLYKRVKDLPIIDYHNHLALDEIKSDRRYLDIYDLWIKPDPYKHRAMRMCAVSEKYITGDATPKEKFIKWCETIPKLIGNPLYLWSLMELKAIFNINQKPNAQNAQALYEKCNEYLKNNTITANSLLKKFNVELACPCASLVDDISFFKDISHLCPSLRGDDIVKPTLNFISELEKTTNLSILSLNDFENAITQRLTEFKNSGCVFSDHALDNGFKYFTDDGQNSQRFTDLLNGKISELDLEKLSSYVLAFLGKEYARLGYVMQLHIGAQRYTSSSLREQVGAAGGFAGIGNSVDVISLTQFLDDLDSSPYGLPKTVLFTLNPSDNALISVLSGSYSKDGAKGIITQGPAWWWCDHKLGIEDMLENTSAFSVLSNFIGMTTDSRSFLSFVRHDYFRRILCNWIGEKVDNGEFICSKKEIEKLIYDLCYGNAVSAVK